MPAITILPFLASVAALLLFSLAAGGLGWDSRPTVEDDHQRMHPE